MPHFEIRPAEYAEVQGLRDLYRQEANVQIVRDSALVRGFAQAYLIRVEGHLAGYGAVGTRYNTGNVLEFYTVPHVRSHAMTIFRELLDASHATHIQAQTNMPLMLMMLYDCAHNITTDAILFQDTLTSRLDCPQATFRPITASEKPLIFEHTQEPVGEWGIEANGAIVATGGFLTHYNPPYADIFMEVAESARRQGVGSYLVQELKRICYEAGKKPAARCGPDNLASRRTLEKAGFLVCGRLLVGEVSTVGNINRK
ncbi:MAG: GNAT family N-acetyltransferase [Anaerolineae bacterium]